MFPCLLVLSEDIRVSSLSLVDALPRVEEQSPDHDARAYLVCGLVMNLHCCHALASRSEKLVDLGKIKGFG